MIWALALTISAIINFGVSIFCAYWAFAELAKWQAEHKNDL